MYVKNNTYRKKYYVTSKLSNILDYKTHKSKNVKRSKKNINNKNFKKKSLDIDFYVKAKNNMKYDNMINIIAFNIINKNDLQNAVDYYTDDEFYEETIQEYLNEFRHLY